MTIDAGAGKAEGAYGTQHPGRDSTPIQPRLVGSPNVGIASPAPDSPKSSETGVKVPEINGGKFRSADHPFFDFGGYIYPGKANPTTTTTTESRVCVVSLVSMLLLLLLNYWLGPKLLNGVEADGTS